MSAATYFDQHVRDQQRVTGTEGNQRFCYRDQAALVESLLRPGMTVLDVGCGASVPYDTRGAYVLGLDSSVASLAQNTDVDERIFASATAIPLPDASVDLVVAMYACHHFTTQTIGGSTIRVLAALIEMERVARTGAEILVFEMRPPNLIWLAELLFWDAAKAILGDRLDACFWPDDFYPERATVQAFHAPWWLPIAPIVSLPWLRMPKFMWPLTPVLYRWTKE